MKFYKKKLHVFLLIMGGLLLAYFLVSEIYAKGETSNSEDSSEEICSEVSRLAAEGKIRNITITDTNNFDFKAVFDIDNDGSKEQIIKFLDNKNAVGLLENYDGSLIRLPTITPIPKDFIEDSFIKLRGKIYILHLTKDGPYGVTELIHKGSERVAVSGNEEPIEKPTYITKTICKFY